MDCHQIYMCFDIVEIWFGNAHWQIRQFLTESSALDMIMVGYYHFSFLFYKEDSFGESLSAFLHKNESPYEEGSKIL